MTQSIPLVRLTHVFMVADYLRRIGFEPEPLMNRLRIPPAFEENKSRFVTSYASGAFVREVTYQTGLPLCVLQGALQGSGDAFYAPEIRLAHTCATLKCFLNILAENVRKESSHVSIYINYEIDGTDSITPILVTTDGSTRGIPQTELYRLGAIIGLVRAFLGKNWLPEALWLHEDHKNRNAIREFFRKTRVCFGSSFAGFSMPYAVLASKPIRHDYVNHARVDGDPYPSRDFVESLKQLMKTYLAHSRTFTVENAAEHSQLSVRSLQRVLNQRMTNFSGLLNQVRFEVGRELLEHSDMPIAEIAHEVGYTDPTCFTHSFRTWTGLSPRAYRKDFRMRADFPT